MVKAKQHVFRFRRRYNKWVADQTLEDYALRFTATTARQWSVDKVAKTALGATAFLALEAISAAVTLQYGFVNTFWAIVAVAVVIIITGLPISYYAARYGLDIDLLTRSAGFGYLGSTLTSLIYATFTFIFFAIEAAILASALHSLLAIPMQIGYLLSALIVIPVVTHGISVISRFQVGSQALWLWLQISAIAGVVFYEWHQAQDWIVYAPHTNTESFNLTLFGAAIAVFFAMTAQIGEQVDYLRFLPEKNHRNQKAWWGWLLLAGPGWIAVGIVKMLFGSFLAYLALQSSADLSQATDPFFMYQMAYGYITSSPLLASLLAGLMVTISQMKINVTNAYAGSIAWSNFFSRLTHRHPGRVVWLVFNVSVALLLMEIGAYQALENILGLFSIVVVSWLGAVAADLLINKPSGLCPPVVEFKRAYLYDINPVGMGSMFVATVAGIVAYLHVWGETAQALAHFISLAICFVMVPGIAILTGGKYYLAPRPEIEVVNLSGFDTHDGSAPGASRGATQTLHCCICENEFEPSDMAYCPMYQGSICSLCCSLDARCHDTCKKNSRLSQQIHNLLETLLPIPLVSVLESRVGRFLVLSGCFNLLTAGLLFWGYHLVSPAVGKQTQLLEHMLWSLFITLMIVSAIVSWLFILIHESRRQAQLETERQTQRLFNEVVAHEKTDQSLQIAKERAEKANNAKTRFVTGINHELRTPLQAITGYSALLLKQPVPGAELNKRLQIILRNGEYLIDLIDGLQDLAKIEAGKLDIYRNTVCLPELLDQLVEMFSFQAGEKAIEFYYTCSTPLPELVMTDEKRLRQILINLLSNAIKYTEKGQIDLSVRYRNQVIEFAVKDTGIGIHHDDLERIFEPFERLSDEHTSPIVGSGLGLSIVKLLIDVMGGQLKIDSEQGVGSCFRVLMLLSSVDDHHQVRLPMSVSSRVFIPDRKSVEPESGRAFPQHPLLDALKESARQGHYKGVNNCFTEISAQAILTDTQRQSLQGLVENIQYEKIIQLLGE